MIQARPQNSLQTEMPFTGDLSHLQFKTEYRSLKEEPAREFYKPCLLNATDYKRAVGFFRSSVYLVVGQSILDFAKRGGRISLIFSSNANSLGGQNSAGFPEICATFQSDNLRRHF